MLIRCLLFGDIRISRPRREEFTEKLRYLHYSGGCPHDINAFRYRIYFDQKLDVKTNYKLNVVGLRNWIKEKNRTPNAMKRLL